MNTPEVKEQDGQNPEDAATPAAAPPKKYHTRRVVFTIIGLVIYFVGVNVWREYRSGAFTPPDPNKAAALEAYKRGLEASSNKDYDLAIAEYTEAIRLAPDDNSNYYFYRAQIYTYQTKEYEKAIADHKESIRLSDNYVSYYCIGDIYMILGDYAAAIDYYEQSLTRKPEDSDVEYKLESAKRLASEPRGRESVQSVAARNMGPLRDAYDKRRIDKPELSGKITVKIAIDESGKVASVQLVNSTMNDREFEDYVASQVKEWTFGKTETEKVGDTVQVVLPLFFGYGG
jgi:TonB family protein